VDENDRGFARAVDINDWMIINGKDLEKPIKKAWRFRLKFI